MVRVPEPGLLDDPLAAVERVCLAPHLVLERALNVAERVHVLDLDLGAEIDRACGLQRDVGVATQRAFFHVAVAHAEVDDHRAEGAQVGGRLLRRADLRLADGLHERHARPVEIHEARLRGLERPLVHELADVLLEVQPLDADGARRAVGQIDLEPALARQRLLVLGDLEILRHVRVVVVLAREATREVDAAVERERGAHAVFDRAAVDHRQRARHALAHGTRLRVRRRAERRRTTAEHLGARGELGVDFEPDDDVPLRLASDARRLRILHRLASPHAASPRLRLRLLKRAAARTTMGVLRLAPPLFMTIPGGACASRWRARRRGRRAAPSPRRGPGR